MTNTLGTTIINKGINEVDMIVPVHYVDWSFFSSNVKSWLKEIPVKTLYFGCNNPDKQYRDELKDYLSQYKKIEFIDQSNFKTLGMQIADLMKRVNTEYFVYCHNDVHIAPYSFLVMEAHMLEGDVGIVEGERVQYSYDCEDNIPKVYAYYHFRERSFSGYQLFKKEAIANILDRIEDDYIYRNEDIIFQNVCEDNGFRYVKALSAMHIHTCSPVNHKWTPNGENGDKARAITFDMQIKGIVKYCSPNAITKKAWRDAFGVCFRENGTDLFEFVDNFVGDNIAWKKAIQETIMDLLRVVYK
jgi:hypothetical protein